MPENKWSIEVIDALALYEGLKKQAGMANGVEWVGFVKKDKKTQVFPFDEGFEKTKFLSFKISRYAMDGNGYHEGYEYFTGIIPVHHKRELNVMGIPWAISPFVVFPQQMDIGEIKPASEPIEYTIEDAKNYLDDCKTEYEEDDDILQLAFDHGMSEGEYCQPDDEFAYEELNHTLEQAIKDMPDYEFSGKDGKRIWNLGDLELDLDEALKGKSLMD